jgi:hypothetical protein
MCGAVCPARSKARNKTQYTDWTFALDPGVHQRGISASSSDSINLNPAPTSGNSGGINISANGRVNLTAMISGIYQGLLFFQARTANDAANVSGGSNMTLSGTFYFPNALLSVTGSAGFDNVGSQYISKDLNVQGTGTIYIDWDPKKAAQTRIIGLVE